MEHITPNTNPHYLPIVNVVFKIYDSISMVSLEPIFFLTRYITMSYLHSTFMHFIFYTI